MYKNLLWGVNDMVKRQVFFSFHYSNDVMRTQQVRNIGILGGNTVVTANKWEEVKKKGNDAIKNWIDYNINNKSCVIVLIGSDTADRKWVKYEIKKAWNDKKGVLGIYIHNLKCPNNGVSTKGKNPFDRLTLKEGTEKLSSQVKCYNPNSRNAYNDIANNINNWIEEAIKIRRNYR